LRDGYHVIKEPRPVNGVVILPILPSGDLLLARVYRRPIEAYSFEFPRGASDPGESLQETAARELLEETGYTAASIELLGYLHSNASLLSSSVGVCRVLIDGEGQSGTDGEASSLHHVSVSQLLAMVRNGEITDGHTLSAVMMAISRSPDRLSIAGDVAARTSIPA